MKTFRLFLVILAVLAVLLALAGPCHAQIHRISATITITNAPTTNGQFITVNSSTRTWTNNPALNPAIYIQTNETQNGSATNLFQHVATYRFVAPINTTWVETNAIKLQGGVGQALSVTIGGEWASVSYATQLVSTPFTVPVRVPLDVETPTNATNIASLLFDGLNRLSTNRVFNDLISTNALLVNPTISHTFSNTLFSANATNRVDGDWSWTMATLSTLTNASLDETNLVTGTNVFARLTLTNEYTLRGLAGGRDGLMKLFWNPTGFSLIFTNESAAAPASSRILTLTGTNVIVTNGIALALYDATTNRWIVVGLGAAGGGSGGGGGSVLAGNSLFVSKTGSDATGTRGDASKPFLTIGAAKTAASAGDTIFVYPGTYTESGIQKNGINYHFYSGAVLASASNRLWEDAGGAPITNIITGDGVFRCTNCPNAFEISTNSFLSMEFERVEGKLGFQLYDWAAKLTLDGGTILTTNECVGIYSTDALVTINRCRLETLGTSWFQVPVFFGNSNTNLVLRDCVLVTPNGTAATNSVHAGFAGVQFRVYGTVIATLTNSINTTILTPASLFQADVDVNR